MKNPLWFAMLVLSLAAAVPGAAQIGGRKPLSHPCASANKGVDWTAATGPKAFSWFEAQYDKYQNKLPSLPDVDVASPQELNKACARFEGEDLKACGAVVDWEMLQKRHIKNGGNAQAPHWVAGFDLEGASADLQDKQVKAAMDAICASYEERTAAAGAAKKQRDADEAQVEASLAQRRVDDAKLQSKVSQVAEEQSDVPASAPASVAPVKPAAAKPAVCGGCSECGKGTFEGNVACTKAMEEPLCNTCN